jgi:hypothetical protein
LEKDLGVILELICLTSNIRKESCGTLDSFISILKKYKEKKSIYDVFDVGS